MRAVTPDQEPGVNAFTLTVGSLQHTSQAVVLAIEGNQLLAALDWDAGCIQVLVQDRLGFRLRYEQDEGKTSVHRTHVPKGHCRNRSALEVQLEASTRTAAGNELLPDAEHLKQFDCACLDGKRAGLMCTVVEAVDDPKARSKTLELRRQRESCWAGAND
jgi:hypothetical protein